MVRLAVAFTAGAALGIAGAGVWWAPLLGLAALISPKSPSVGPGKRLLWVAVGLCGLLAVLAGGQASRCRPRATEQVVVLVGRFLGTPSGGSAAFRAGPCPPFTVVVPGGGDVPPGRSVRVAGTWQEGRGRAWFLASRVESAPDQGDGALRWRAVRWRADLVRRLDRLYGDRAPLVAALTLARTEGFDPELREAFARVGIAHLLAISGFHVGVIAGLVLVLLRGIGFGARPSELGAAGVAWAYVGLIGFPDPAARAALMLSLVAVARSRGRPTAAWGPLAASWLVLVAGDPHRMESVGFQLSFAGVAGLVAWSGPLASWIRGVTKRRLPHAFVTAVAAGVAATLATLPIVAWHFERVALVGIPVTLLATPLVSLALMGALLSLAVDFVSPSLAGFLAGGVSVALAGLEAVTEVAASWEWASVWTTRSSVWAGALGVAAASWAARRPRVGARARRSMIAAYLAAGVLAWPILLTWQSRGTAELLVIDVGQGDAIGLRTPRGRWILVDAGPPVRGSDPGGHPSVRALRARGVRRIEALVLTHPDLDHIGGAVPILRAFEVGAVYDPGLASPKEEFVDVLEAAQARAIPWRAARAGDRWDLDGVVLEVLHPAGDLPAEVETNETSVVLRVTFGSFEALLTGDAYRATERSILPHLSRMEVIKVGHHGSETSTDSLLVERVRPELALISVGRSNRYGHPAPEILGRLERAGARVARTDREGTLSVLARRDGSFQVVGEKAGRRGSGSGPR